MLKYRNCSRGDKRDDGMIFWGYINNGKEWWTTEEKFTQRMAAEPARQKAWRKTDAGNVSFTKALSRYRASNKGRIRSKEYHALYDQSPKARAGACAREGKRRAVRSNCEVAEKKEISFLYNLCQAFNNGGVVHHVDHIHPIARGGKHSTYNLRIVPAIVNMKKGCKVAA